MKERWRRSLILATSAIFFSSAGVFAQTSSPATPDFSGVWDHPNQDPRLKLTMVSKEPEMLPEAAARYKEIRKGMVPLGGPKPDQGRTDMDPAAYPYCMPYGYPRVYAQTDSFEVLHAPGRVYILFESGAVQRIYTDGRQAPKGPPLTFMGQSIGRWEGDTLVVETKDINELTWLDGTGHIHSDALRIQQRIRRVDHNTMEMNFVFDDPKTYPKPWTAKKIYKLQPASEMIMNYFLCEDPKHQDFEKQVLGKNEPAK